MRCAPSSWGRRTACSSGHDHAQPSRYSHHAQRRCTRRVRAQTGPCSTRAACVGASNAHIGAFASRPRGLLARQPAGVQPSTLHITARATEPSGSGAEAVSDEVRTASWRLGLLGCGVFARQTLGHAMPELRAHSSSRATSLQALLCKGRRAMPARDRPQPVGSEPSGVAWRAHSICERGAGLAGR